MTASKTLVTVSSVAMALIFGGGLYLVMNLGSVAQKITERVASNTLGVKVTIGQMDVSLQDRTVSVAGLKIANPHGFRKLNALTVDKIDIVLESVSRELIRFKNIAVVGTSVNLEVQENGTNLNTIKSEVKTAPAEAVDQKEQLKVIIDRLAITQASLNPSVLLLADQELQPVVVPDIYISGVGEGKSGLPVHEAIAQIWTVIADVMSKSANNAGFYQGLSAEALEDIGVGQVELLGKQIKEEAGKIGESIKGLFGD